MFEVCDTWLSDRGDMETGETRETGKPRIQGRQGRQEDKRTGETSGRGRP